MLHTVALPLFQITTLRFSLHDLYHGTFQADKKHLFIQTFWVHTFQAVHVSSSDKQHICFLAANSIFTTLSDLYFQAYQ